MKLKQRIVIEYYSTKFKLLSLISPRKAAKSAFELFCTPYTSKRTEKPTSIFEAAESLSLVVGGYLVNGFKWKPTKQTNGKSILICHGFDSCCYRFSDYIEPFLNEGFEVLAFDAPGHGISSGKTINILLYGEMIELINKTFGPVYGIMAHSFGALATVLVVEKNETSSFKKVVLIAPSTETVHAIDNFFKYIKINVPVQNEFYRLIEEMGGNPAEWYSVSRAVENINANILWIHDKNDNITPYRHMKHLLDKNLHHIQFEITEGLGHSPYREPHIIKRIVDFFTI